MEALLRANKKAFAAEVERVDFELLDRLLPVVWPECLVKLGSIKPTDAEALCCFIDGDGLDDAEGVAQDIATLERLKRLIDETLSLLATRLKARTSKDGIA